MKTLTATAIAAVLAVTPALANDAMNTSNASKQAYGAKSERTMIRTRDITGGAIYTFNEANDEGWTPDMTYHRVGKDWNEIGEVEDIVLSRDGKMIGIIAEVGGFLDMGDKHVMISASDMNLVATDDDEYALITRLNEEELEALQGVDESYWN